MLDIMGWKSGWLDWKLGWRVCGEKRKIKIKLISLSLVLPWEEKKKEENIVSLIQDLFIAYDIAQ